MEWNRFLKLKVVSACIVLLEGKEGGRGGIEKKEGAGYKDNRERNRNPEQIWLGEDRRQQQAPYAFRNKKVSCAGLRIADGDSGYRMNLINSGSEINTKQG